MMSIDGLASAGLYLVRLPLIHQQYPNRPIELANPNKITPTRPTLSSCRQIIKSQDTQAMKRETAPQKNLLDKREVVLLSA